MTDDSKSKDQPEIRRKKSSDPISYSRVDPVQRVVRERHSDSAVKGSSRLERQFDSGELSLIEHSAEQAKIMKSLAEASIGIERFQDYGDRIQRGFSAGKKHYILGAEFAITAIITIAGIARRRADLSGANLSASTGSDIASGATLSPGKFDHGKDSKLSPGLMKDVPEWLISLDGSVAAEAGYLFASVLKRPTVLMTMQDTFVSLAESHFHDSLLGWLIVDLNIRKMKEFWKGPTKIVAVRNGETIELPVWEDIVEFYQSKPREAKPDNLLTVVLKRSLDRELVEAALATLVQPGTVNMTASRGNSDLADEWVARRSAANLRIHRLMYENLNSWSRMEKYLRKKQFGRTL